MKIKSCKRLASNFHIYRCKPTIPKEEIEGRGEGLSQEESGLEG